MTALRSLVEPPVPLLVTGGDGLLGQALRPLCPDGVFVTRADADLTDLAATRRLFERLRPRRVLHLAAWVGGVRFNREHDADLLTVNARIDDHVLSAAREHRVQRLVGLLSSCAFRIPEDRPAGEADLHEGLPYEGNLGYGTAKRLLDLRCRVLFRQYGCRFSTLAPVTLYGPHDRFDPDQGHVVAALLWRCEEARRQGAPLTVWGTGDAVRQFVFAADVARLLLRELEVFDGPGTTIVAPDLGLTIRELATAIAAACGFTGPILFDGAMEGVRCKRISSQRLLDRQGARAFTPLETGLAATLAWFRGQTHLRAGRTADALV